MQSQKEYIQNYNKFKQLQAKIHEPEEENPFEKWIKEATKLWLEREVHQTRWYVYKDEIPEIPQGWVVEVVFRYKREESAR